jgi:hypothetical protein
MKNDVIHVPDTTGQRSLCGTQLPDECPTYSVPEEDLMNCSACQNLAAEGVGQYAGNILTGYYPK